MKERREAELLGEAMLRVGETVGLQISYLLTPMNEPLGRTVGNALELAEAIDVLRGAGPPDVANLVLDLAIRVANAPRDQLQRWLQDGTAWKKFVTMVEAQDGDATALEKMTQIHRAPVIREIKAKRRGRIAKMDAQRIGRASLLLGGGRQTADDAIDFAVGVSDLKKVGESVEPGEVLMCVHARAEKSCERAVLMLNGAVAIE